MSQQNIRTKQLPEEVPTDDAASVEEEVVGGKDYSGEPYGSQVLRAMHEHGSKLMKEYDEMMPHLEHESVKDYASQHMSALDKHLTAIEKLHKRHYKDLEPLAGAMEEDVKDEPVVEADSTEEGLPTPEEAVEGMQTKDDGEGDVPEIGELGEKSLAVGQVWKSSAGTSWRIVEVKGDKVKVEREDRPGDTYWWNEASITGTGMSQQKSLRRKNFPEANEQQGKVNLNKPAGPSNWQLGKEPMQQFGKKHFSSLSKAWAFLKDLPEEEYDEGKRLTAHICHKQLEEAEEDLKKSFPELEQAIARFDVNNPKGKLTYTPGQEPMQQFENAIGFKHWDVETRPDGYYIVYDKTGEEEGPLTDKVRAVNLASQYNADDEAAGIKSLRLYKTLHLASSFLKGMSSVKALESSHKRWAKDLESALAKETSEIALTKPTGPSKYTAGKEPMQQFGKKNLRNKYKDLPLDEQVGEVNVEQPTSPSAYKPGKEKLQQFEGKLAEVKSFLKDLGDEQEFNEEHKLKAYHYHKQLEDDVLEHDKKAILAVLRGPADTPEKTESIWELPIVFTGTQAKVNNRASEMGLKWKPDRGMLAGGYWADSSGNTYYMDLKRLRKDLPTDEDVGEYGEKIGPMAAAAIGGLAGGMGGKAAPGTPEWEAEEAMEPEHKGLKEDRQRAADAAGRAAEVLKQAISAGDERAEAEARREYNRLQEEYRKAREREKQVGDKAWHKDGEELPEVLEETNKYLKALAFCKDFGDPHRNAAKALYKQLEEWEAERKALCLVCGEDPCTCSGKGLDDDLPEPGAMGEKDLENDKEEKALRRIKAAFDKQNEEVAEFTKKLTLLNGKV